MSSPSHRAVDGDFDLVVIGGGIVGLAAAWEAGRRDPGLSICVLEKEAELARHQSGQNSGVIHAGVYYAAGSLKARLCRLGKGRLEEFCEEREIPFRRLGKLIVAVSEEEIPRLDALEERARANEVDGLRRIDSDGIAAIEPNATGLAALHSPGTGVIDFREVAEALAADLISSGQVVAVGHEVTGIESGRDRTEVMHARGRVTASRVLCCGGAWSDRLAGMSGGSADPRIVPFRGSYLEVVESRQELVRGMIYPVPDPELPFLGVHLTRHVDGSLTIGPTAMLAGSPDPRQPMATRLRDLGRTASWPGTPRMIWNNRASARHEISNALFRRRLIEAARSFVPALRPEDVRPSKSGIRAQAVTRDGELADDFVFDRTGRVLHVRNAPSPGATSSLAIADHLVDLLDEF